MKNSRSPQKITGCLERSECPITNTLEGIATNILTDRLKRLEDHGIIEKSPYPKTPVRYEYGLTRRGENLRSVLMEMIRWGNAHIEGTFVPPPKLLKK